MLLIKNSAIKRITKIKQITVQTMEARISDLLDEKFKEPDFVDCYMIDINLNPTVNKLELFIDSDSGMTFEKCQKISRYLESHFDENKWFGEDYTLEVSSPGVMRPLKLPRQYPKNVGRNIEITTKEGSKKEGKLVEATDFAATVEELVITKEGKKKKKELVQTIIPYDEINKAVIKIQF